MEMSVSLETTFFSMKLQPEICPQLRTGSSAEDRGRIDTRVINTTTTRYQGKYHGYFSVKTIHSKSQLEHFRGMVYDSAKATGGHQMVVTHKGYAIPLHVCNGLFYIDMSPASNLDMDLYPHVFLTTDCPWNPDIIDEEFFYDASYSILDIPQVQTHRYACDPHLDGFGNVCSNDWIHNPGSFCHVLVDAIIDQVVFTLQTMAAT